MKKNYLKTITLINAILGISLLSAQVKQQPIPNFVNPFQSKVTQKTSPILAPKNGSLISNVKQAKLEIINGSFSINLEKQNITKEKGIKYFNDWFNLNPNHSFQQISEKTGGLHFDGQNRRRQNP